MILMQSAITRAFVNVNCDKIDRANLRRFLFGFFFIPVRPVLGSRVLSLACGFPPV